MNTINDTNVLVALAKHFIVLSPQDYPGPSQNREAARVGDRFHVRRGEFPGCPAGHGADDPRPILRAESRTFVVEAHTDRHRRGRGYPLSPLPRSGTPRHQTQKRPCGFQYTFLVT